MNGPPAPPLRICYLTSVMLTDRAGTERHLIRLSQGLDRRRFRVQLLTLQDSPFSENWPYASLPLHSFGFRSLYHPSSWWKIRQIAQHLRKHRCQVLELHSPEAQFIGTLAGRWAGCQLVSCRRSLGYQFHRTQRWQLASTNRFVHHFLANAQAVADQRSQVENIPQEHFSVIFNGAHIEPCTEETQGDPLATEHPWLVVVANLRAVKNHRLLFQAIKLLERDQLFPHCALIGAGPEEQPLRQLASELQMDHRIRFLGSLPSVQHYLAQADIGCLPSDSEGFPNAVLDYMGAGLPVVATAVGGTSEAVIEGSTGFLVPPGDASSLAARLQQLLANPALRESMGAAGRQRVETHFSFTKELAAYEDFYEQICATGSR